MQNNSNNQEELLPKKFAAKLKTSSVTNEMEKSYLDYAMSVIVARALPDVRDGLKPVHRRIFYSMHKMGLHYKAKFQKCARVVGDVMGKYHPHGDMAIYMAMVNLAQDFSTRYPLIDGQGNFGSIDNDPPASMRYTECRMTKIDQEMLRDIGKETVDFQPTYDDTRIEPSVLPAAVPNLLLNGQVGIAVGMATNIPPHNLKELIDASIYLIDNPESETIDLLKFVKGPDFPTGGIIYNQQDIISAYSTGRGGMVTRGVAEIVESKKNNFQIIISEITYQTNKAAFISHIAKLARDKKIDGIRNIIDESNKEGIRIVVDLKRDVSPHKILNQLYKYTDLQKTYHLNMLALVNGIQPEVLNLRQVLKYYVDFRFKVVKRGFEYDLKIARNREHILEGLKKALDHIDEIIKLIKASKTKEIAHKNLMKEFKFSKIQATAILEMRLQQLAGLERKKIEDELKEIKAFIEKLLEILGSKEKLWDEVKKLLSEVREKYGDARKTKVVKQPLGEFNEEDFVEEEKVIVLVTKGGYVKRMPHDFYRAQKRGGKGVKGMITKEEDIVDKMISLNSLDEILFFTNKGRAFKVKAFEIPETKRATNGQALVNFLELKPEEIVTSVLPVQQASKFENLTMVTKLGTVKRLKIESLKNIRRSGLIVIGLKDNDQLQKAVPTSGEDHIVIVSKKGKAIRFKETDVRTMGRTASGVRSIRLKKDDSVIGVGVFPSGEVAKNFEIFTIAENGFGKRSSLDSYKVQRRGGTGLKAATINKKTGDIAGMIMVNKIKLEKTDEMEEEDDENAKDTIVISKRGQIIRLPIKDIKTLGRATQGVTLMRLKSKDKVAAVAFV